jgi:ribosomal protein S27AE
MKVCPQCSGVYPDDFLFCLTDGNVLTDENGEQETIISNKIDPGKVSPLPLECPTCGMANGDDSRFCKKCGGALAGADPRAQQFPAAVNAPFDFVTGKSARLDEPRETYPNIAYNAPVFTPPASAGYQTGGGKKRQTNIIVAALIMGVLIITGSVIYSSQSGPSAGTKNGKPSPSPQATVRKGRLTTNQRMRSDSNKYAEIIGVHYQGAKVDILEERTFTTDDGTLATWYRVRVVQNGCDKEGSLGCGNDLNGVPGQAATEGWMNAKYIAPE